VKFQQGTQWVPLTNGDAFQIQGLGDRVEFQSLSRKDWYFDKKVIYPNELPLTQLKAVKGTDVMTITATANHDNYKQYSISFVKFLNNGQPKLRIIHVGVLPELAEFSLVLGLFGLGCVMMRRRRVN